MGIKGHNWVTRRIVSFVQDKASKQERASEKYGSSHGGTKFTVKASEAPRPRDKMGKEIPPPPSYVRPDPMFGGPPINQPRVAPFRAHAPRDATEPVISFPEPPGLIRRYEHNLMIEEIRVVDRPEPPPRPRGIIGGILGTPWSPWEREDPPGTRDRRDDENPQGWGGGGGRSGGPPSGHWGDDGYWHDD